MPVYKIPASLSSYCSAEILTTLDIPNLSAITCNRLEKTLKQRVNTHGYYSLVSHILDQVGLLNVFYDSTTAKYLRLSLEEQKNFRAFCGTLGFEAVQAPTYNFLKITEIERSNNYRQTHKRLDKIRQHITTLAPIPSLTPYAQDLVDTILLHLQTNTPLTFRRTL